MAKIPFPITPPTTTTNATLCAQINANIAEQEILQGQIDTCNKNLSQSGQCSVKNYLTWQNQLSTNEKQTLALQNSLPSGAACPKMR